MATLKGHFLLYNHQAPSSAIERRCARGGSAREKWWQIQRVIGTRAANKLSVEGHGPSFVGLKKWRVKGTGRGRREEKGKEAEEGSRFPFHSTAANSTPIVSRDNGQCPATKAKHPKYWRKSYCSPHRTDVGHAGEKE